MTSDTNIDPSTVGPEYQGWSNRETWAASLHLSNTEWLYNAARELVARNAGLTGSAWMALEEWCVELIDENRETIDGYGAEYEKHNAALTMMDREVGSWWRVNWREVADGLMGD